MITWAMLAVVAAPLRVVVGVDAHDLWRTPEAAQGTELVRALGAAEVRRLRRALVIDLNVEDPAAALRALRARANVRWAEPEVWLEVRLRATPDDPRYPEQWALHPVGDPAVAPDVHIGAEAAWEITRGTGPGDEPVRIAILDDGFDLLHPDLNFADGGDFASGDALLWDDDASFEGSEYHGTQTAGVAAAIGFNGRDVVGACPECAVLPVRLIGGGGAPDLYTTASTVAAAIDWAVHWAAAGVVNNSWGPPDGNPFVAHDQTLFPLASEEHLAGEMPLVLRESLRSALRDGRDGLGTLIVWSAGNGNELVTYDGFAASPFVLAVGSLDARGERAFYSDYGPPLFLVAPSSGASPLPAIVTSDVSGPLGVSGGDTTDAFGGTSAAAALVSGAAALVIAAYPELTAAQVAESLAHGARLVDPVFGGYVVGRSPTYGFGALDVPGALAAAALYDGPCSDGLELCNDRDDDCDGQVDEGDTCVRCIPDAPREGCDGHDNDCDTEIDEDFVCQSNDRPTCAPCANTSECALGLNCRPSEAEAGTFCLVSCANDDDCPPRFTCDGEVCQVDPAGTLPSCAAYLQCNAPETCNGRDDDCDGQSDDIAVADTLAAQAACQGEGVCADAAAICALGAWRCVPPADFGDERCDGRDNDCDGDVDETCSGCTAIARSGDPHGGFAMLGLWALFAVAARRRRAVRWR